MSQFSMFMREKKKAREVKKYAPSADFVDENGQKIEWEFVPLTTADWEQLRTDCTQQKITKQGVQSKVDIKMLNALTIVKTCKFPDLNDEELQENYGADDAVELLWAMIDNPGEYNDLVAFVQTLCGFQKEFEEKVEAIKN